MKKVNQIKTEKSEVSLAIWGNDLILRVGLPGAPAGPFIEFYREIQAAFHRSSLLWTTSGKFCVVCLSILTACKAGS